MEMNVPLFLSIMSCAYLFLLFLKNTSENERVKELSHSLKERHYKLIDNLIVGIMINIMLILLILYFKK